MLDGTFTAGSLIFFSAHSAVDDEICAVIEWITRGWKCNCLHLTATEPAWPKQCKESIYLKIDKYLMAF
jgi:hypothetical protein